jgi:ribose-phosphate pyrophosphokinase
MSVLLLAMPGEEARAERLAPRLAAEVAAIGVGRPRKGVRPVTVPDNARGRPVAVLTTLEDPDLPRLTVWDAARQLRAAGATSVGLAAPHAAYLDTDDAQTRVFAELLAAHFDWLVTVDAHPGGLAALQKLFKGPVRVVTAAPAVAGWIRKNVANPVLIGLDSSAEPWVGAAARKVGSPFVVLQREEGELETRPVVPDAERWWSYAPVLVSDKVRSGAEVARLVRKVVEEGLPAPVVVTVHGVYDREALAALADAGATKVVSCDTVPHETNGVRLDAELAQAINALAGR